MPEALKILFSPPMNIRTHIQALLICTMPLSAQGQSIMDSRASLPRAVQLHGDEGRETVRPDESKRISPNEAPASRVQPQRIVNRIAATVNGRPITANEVSVRLMPIGAQLAAEYPKQGPEFYKQLALAKKNIIEDLVERELLRNEFEGMGGVIRDSLIDQEVNRTILTTFNGDRSAFLKNLSLSGMTIRSREDMEAAAKRISEESGCAVLCKGGHQINDADDLLWQGGTGKWFKGKRIANPNTHGTGCTLSSAIASNLAKGYDLDTAVERAKAYISGCLSAMLDLGHGSGPMDHTFNLKGDFVRD